MTTEIEVVNKFRLLKKSGDLIGVYRFLYALEIPDLLVCLRGSGIHSVSDTELKKAVIESCTREINTQVRKAIVINPRTRVSLDNTRAKR